MGEPLEKSVYVVETSVGPGGSRWAELHAYTDLAHIRQVIDRFCANGGGLSAYHSIWYGAKLGVWTIQRGEVTGFLDLHPFIEVKLGDKPAVRLDDTDEALKLVVERRREIRQREREDEEENEEDESADDEYDDIDEEIYEQIEMKADWEAIAARLPPLEAPLLQSGERAAQKNPRDISKHGSYFFLDGNIRFGSYEVECGVTLDGPVPFKTLPSYLEDEEDEEDEEEDSEDEDAED